MEMTLKVECAVRAWGVSSWIESFLCDSARKTYSKWLDYAAQRVNESTVSALETQSAGAPKTLNDTNLDTFSPTVDSAESKELIQQNGSPQNVISQNGSNGIHQNVVHQNGKVLSSRIGSGTSVLNSPSERMSYGQMPSPPIHIRRDRKNEKMNGEHHVVHIVEMDGMGRRSSDEFPEVHESRGIFKKEKVSCTLRMCRCVMRVCPSWFLSEKKNNIDLLVDTRCQCLEKTLWCVIVLCLTMILFLAVHGYLTL